MLPGAGVSRFGSPVKTSLIVAGSDVTTIQRPVCGCSVKKSPQLGLAGVEEARRRQHEADAHVKRDRSGRGGRAIAAEGTPPGYRDRLRVEGATLAACGAVGSVALLVATDQAMRGPWSTIGQLAVLAILLAVLGPWATRRAMDGAQPIGPDAAAAGTGEPTPLWQLPVIVAVLSIPFGLLIGWDPRCG